MKLEFPEYTPDQAPLGGGAQVAQNVVPNAKGYDSLNSITQVSDAIDARCRGAIAVRDSNGIVYTYAGTGTRLYELETAIHADVSKAGNYSLGDEESWNFVKWGDTLIAVNINTPTQSITLGGANFADLAGSPPKAKFITIINNFVVMANINDGVSKPDFVRWSAINDQTDWTSDADTQSDSQQLFSDSETGSGEIRGITGGEYGNIFTEFSIWRMTYVGSPLIFEFKEVLPSIGLLFKNSLTQQGRISHFIGQDAFYQLIDGSQIKDIGKNKVSKYFFDRVSETFAHRVVGASDPRNSLVFWIYPSTASANGQPDSIIIYDYLNDKWSTAVDSLDWIFSAPREGYTLEDLDAFSASIDTLGSSLDSSAWKTKNLALSVYDTEFKKGVFTGTAQDATVTTQELQLSEGRRTKIRGVEPLVEGSAVTASVAVGVRDKQSDNVEWSATKPVNSRSGSANFQIDGKYARARITTTGDFNYITGVDFDIEVSSVV